MGNDLAPVLVTGAAGYLGGQVLINLKARHIPCTATSRDGSNGATCDLTDSGAVRRLLDQVRPRAIIHCAARVPKSMTAYDDSRAAEASVAMVRAISDLASCPVVLASSMTVYSRTESFPVVEDEFPPPAAGYAQGKWLAEQVLFSRSMHGDVALRLPGLFGMPRRSGLLYNAAKAFLLGTGFSISSSKEIWAAMAVTDAAEYLVRAALNISDVPPQAVNAGYAGTFTIPAAVAEIAALCGVAWQPPGGQATPFSMCLQQLENRYGIIPATFRQRLAELIDAVRGEMAMERRGNSNEG